MPISSVRLLQVQLEPVTALCLLGVSHFENLPWITHTEIIGKKINCILDAVHHADNGASAVGTLPTL